MAWPRRLPLAIGLAAMLGVTAASQESSGENFYTAIRANDLARLDGLLTVSGDVNAKDERGITALMLSATEIAKVQLLKDRGARMNAASTRGRTALFLAAMSDRSADIVRLMISAGADLRVVDSLCCARGTTRILA